jgi:capsular exopolysaccharide synthesis family protein
MSKIYEALQRAEEERRARASTSEPIATPEAAPDLTPPDQDRAAEPVPFASEGAATGFVQIADRRGKVQPAAIAPAGDARHFVRSGTPDEIFDAVAATRWNPQLDKLPSLGDRGHAVEQFRSLRTRLFAFRDLNKLKSIMVGSGLPREGKSFIAANLSVSFARHKATRVLLIDGDMRRSSLHDLLGCRRSPGLSTYLAGHAEIPDILQRMEITEDLPVPSGLAAGLTAGLGSLTFIGGGDEGDKAADLSGSKRFHALIDRASQYFDWIIVDSSPVNLVTDGVNLAHACDAVLMVARGGVTRFEAAQRALAELKHSNILGVVLNASDRKARDAGYYGYDGYDGYDGYYGEHGEDSAAIQEQETGQVAQ